MDTPVVDGLWFMPYTENWEPLIDTWRRGSQYYNLLVGIDWHRSWIFGDATGPMGCIGLQREPESLVARLGNVCLRRGTSFPVAVVKAVTAGAFAQGSVRVTTVATEGGLAEQALQQSGFRKLRIAGNKAWWAATSSGVTPHSVIVGSYNRPRYIRQALRSVLEQYGPNWQMIVTDDGSDAETLSAIREVIRDDPRCELLVWRGDVSKEERGMTAHVRAVQRINDAIPLCYGELVHYLPDDDYFAPERFLAFEGIFRRPEVHIAYGRLRYVDGDTVSSEDRFPGSPVNDPHCLLDHSQVVHRRSAFDRQPRWIDDINTIGYASDGVFYRALVQKGLGPIWPVDHLVSYKRRHAFNMLVTQHGSGGQRE
jgi:hypothetical protein